jgi:hypothetical protein
MSPGRVSASLGCRSEVRSDPGDNAVTVAFGAADKRTRAVNMVWSILSTEERDGEPLGFIMVSWANGIDEELQLNHCVGLRSH